MAEPYKLKSLSNKDIIRLTNKFGRDDYYRLGKVLGFGEDVLDHLWHSDQKGCALQMVLLWKDGLTADDDQRAILAEKLSEAGLEDKKDFLLHGLPTLPDPCPSPPGYSITSITTSNSPPERNNNTDPTGVSDAPFLPQKQSKYSDKDLHLSAVHAGGNGTEVFLPNVRDEEEDDSSDNENYINVSNKTLQKGSVTIALVSSKPRHLFNDPQGSTISEQRQSLVLETKPLISHLKLARDDITAKEEAEECDCQNADEEAVHQSQSKPHSLSNSATPVTDTHHKQLPPPLSTRNSSTLTKPAQDYPKLAEEKIPDHSSTEATSTQHQALTQNLEEDTSKVPAPSATTILPQLNKSADQEQDDLSPVAEYRPSPSPRTLYPLKTNQQSPSPQSNGKVSVDSSHDMEGQSEVPKAKDDPHLHGIVTGNISRTGATDVKVDSTVLPVEKSSTLRPQLPPPVSPRTSLTLKKPAQDYPNLAEEKIPGYTNTEALTQNLEEDTCKVPALSATTILPQMNKSADQEQEDPSPVAEYRPSPSPRTLYPLKTNQQSPSPQSNGKVSVDSSHDMEGSSEVPKAKDDPDLHGSVTGNISRTGEGNVRKEHVYASIDTEERSPHQKAKGPPVAPYQPKASQVSAAFPSHDDSKAANGKWTLQPQPHHLPESVEPRGGRLHEAPTTRNNASNKQQGPSFQIQQGINEDVLRALASDITTCDQLKKLGLELGFQEAELNGFDAMNQRTDPRSMQGSLEMLLKWRSKVSSEDQSLLLKHALRRSGLMEMSEAHLKASARRRDIRNVKIAKNFTVSDCREKLEFHYRTDTCKILKKHEFSNSTNQLPVIVVHRIVKRGKNLHVEKVVLEGAINEILKTRKDGALPTRIVIFGPPGVGKTTLAAHMAHDWAEKVEGSPLQDVTLLFVLKMKFVNNHGSLGQVIINQLLSNVRGLTPQGIDQLIEDNQSECMVVFDGLDEFKGEISSIKCGHVLRVVHNIQLKKCRVIVTSHPRLEDYFNKENLPNDFLKMELQGFSHLQSVSFIRSFFRENRLHKADELIVFLRMNDVLSELLTIPLFCLMVCHLWESNLLQLVTTESEFYDSVNRFFLRHGEEKAAAVSGDTDLEMIMQGMGEVVLSGMLEDPNRRTFGQSDFKKIPATSEKALALGIINKSTSKKREDDNIEFYHRNSQEHCVAKYLSREVTSKSAKGKPSRLNKALKQMTKKSIVGYGGVLRFTAGLGSHSIRLNVIEAIHSAESTQLGDKCRMILDCLAEIPELDKQTSYAVERCFAGGNMVMNLPTTGTTLGFYKLPPSVKEKVRSVTIHSSFMRAHVAKKLSRGLQGCPDLLKLEVADVQNPTYPVILLLANKLSLHLSPEGALSVLPDLNQIVFNGLRLVNLSGCHLSNEASKVLWNTLSRCPHIETMSVKNSTILGRDLPQLGCIAVLQANLRSPVQPEEVRWLSSILGDQEYSSEVRLTIGDTEDGTIRRTGVGIQEHMLMADDRLDLTNATRNTIQVLNVLPDSYRRKVRSLCIKRTRFTGDLTRPLLDIVHSLIRLEQFTTEDCNVPDELKQLQVFKGSLQRPVNELPMLNPGGVLMGRVSSPIREEEFERLSSAFKGTTAIKQVHLLVEHNSKSHTNFQEILDITGDNMELCNVSAATIEILKMLPASFKKQMQSARIRNCNLTDELSQLLSEALQSMGKLEMFLSENSILGQKALHLTSVTVLELGRFSSMCFDWEWLESAVLLEELHLTFASSLPTTPTSPTSLSLPATPTTPTTQSAPKGACATTRARGSGLFNEDVTGRLDTEAAFEEDLYLQIAYGRLVMTRMSSCSLSVMLHLPKHLKDELKHVRIRSTKLSVDVLNQLGDVQQSFRHLSPLSLQILYRRPIKYGCILQPGASIPVVGQWD